ncbi:hypothetical protein CRT23_24265 [Methylobacterium sp. V23]|nr:hypothetical protein CRT23_24265 [Methylobacterium sp. V23]
MLIDALVVKEEHVGQAMDDLEEIEDQRAQLRAERKAMMPGASASRGKLAVRMHQKTRQTEARRVGIAHSLQMPHSHIAAR